MQSLWFWIKRRHFVSIFICAK